MRSITLVTPPVREPVTLEEVKAWLKLETTDEDSTLLQLIGTARQMVEHYTSRALLAQTWRLVTTTPLALPFVVLPKAPTLKLLSAALQDDAGHETPLDLEGLWLDGDSDPQRLVMGATSLAGETGRGRVRFDLVFGYGEEAASVPDALRQAVLVMVAQAYEQRGAPDTPSVYPALALLAPYCLRRVS